MSEETCQACGKNPCACSGKQNIKVSVSLSEEMKKAIAENALLKKQLEEKDAANVVANEALAEAEGKLQADEKYRREHPPAGKSTFTPPGNAEEYKDRVEMIDKLYDAAYFHRENYPPEIVKDSKAKIEKLISSMVNGPSWKELGKGTKPILQHELGTCQNCGFTLVDTSKCPNCSYDPSVRTRVQNTRLGGKEEAYKAPKVVG